MFKSIIQSICLISSVKSFKFVICEYPLWRTCRNDPHFSKHDSLRNMNCYFLFYVFPQIPKSAVITVYEEALHMKQPRYARTGTGTFVHRRNYDLFRAILLLLMSVLMKI